MTVRSLAVAVAVVVLPVAAGLIFTVAGNFCLAWLRRHYPPRAPQSPEATRALAARNRGIDALSSIVGAAAILVPIMMFKKQFDGIGWPAVGILFGLFTILQFLTIAVFTLPSGVRRFREFFLYLQVRGKMALGPTLVMYGVFMAFALISAVVLVARAFD